MTGSVNENAYQTYLAALLAGDRAECGRIVKALAAGGADLQDLYVDVFQRALYAVGELWETQRISVATEHLATATTERMLTLLQPMVFGGGPRSRSIVVACVAGEFHQVGGRMIADLCELKGWRGYFLGSDTPAEGLLRAIDERRPAMLGLSLSLPTNFPTVLSAIKAITTAHPDLPIVVGGQAFRFGARDAIAGYPNVACLASFSELEPRLTDFPR